MRIWNFETGNTFLNNFNPFIMKIFLAVITFVFGTIILSLAQTKSNSSSTAPVWTEVDRKYLLDNLIRSKEEIIAETKNLTKEQWNFKESPNRWSINQIVEHICICELIHMNEISTALQMGPIPEFPNYLHDSH